MRACLNRREIILADVYNTNRSILNNTDQVIAEKAVEHCMGCEPCRQLVENFHANALSVASDQYFDELLASEDLMEELREDAEFLRVNATADPIADYARLLQKRADEKSSQNIARPQRISDWLVNKQQALVSCCVQFGGRLASFTETLKAVMPGSLSFYPVAATAMRGAPIDAGLMGYKLSDGCLRANLRDAENKLVGTLTLNGLVLHGVLMRKDDTSSAPTVVVSDHCSGEVLCSNPMSPSTVDSDVEASQSWVLDMDLSAFQQRSLDFYIF